MLVKSAEPELLEKLQQQFQHIDTDGTGLLNAEELKKVFIEAGLPYTDVDDIIKNADQHGNSKINYTEFISATFEVQNFLTEERLWALFCNFDVDETQQISADNLTEAFARMGKKTTKEEVEQIIETHDINYSGQLNFDEFKCIFQGKEEDCKLGSVRQRKSLVGVQDIIGMKVTKQASVI